MESTLQLFFAKRKSSAKKVLVENHSNNYNTNINYFQKRCLFGVTTADEESQQLYNENNHFNNLQQQKNYPKKVSRSLFCANKIDLNTDNVLDLIEAQNRLDRDRIHEVFGFNIDSIEKDEWELKQCIRKSTSKQRRWKKNTGELFSNKKKKFSTSRKRLFQIASDFYNVKITENNAKNYNKDVDK